MLGFKNKAPEDVPIALDELYRRYCELTERSYPIREMPYISSWMLFRVRINCPNRRSYILMLLFFLFAQLAIISQGIAARYVRKQASSADAAIHLELFPRLATLAKDVLIEAGSFEVPRSKL